MTFGRVRRAKRWAPVAALVALLPTEAFAQQATGFGVSRFDPSERGSEWFVLESLDLRGHVRPALGIVGEYQYRPLVIYNGDGSVRSPIVAHDFIVHLGGAINLWDRLRLGVNIPLQLYATGDGGTLAGVNYAPPSNAQSIGDIRLGADVRLFGQYGDVITGAVGLQAGLPTGSRESYSGDGAIRLAPRALIAGDVGPIAYGAKVGFQYRHHSVTFGSSPVGSEFFYAASIGLRVADRKLVIGPEVFGSSVTDGDQFFGRRTTPLEGLLGAHYTAGELRFGAGAGTGLTRGFGTPVVHILANLEWVPATETKAGGPSDRDHDGIYDQDDACPDDPGLKTNDPTTHGCPDRDKDGIFDKDDACIDEPGHIDPDPKLNGCPDRDRDKDGVVDKDDACPDVPGLKTADPKTNGCPDPDRDKDGIPNDQDACPDEPGKPDPDPKRNGCPKAFVKDGQIMILDQVKFKTSSAEILPGKDSLDVLEAVQRVLKDHMEIMRVRIEGHTDSRGDKNYNKTLSANRAAAVVKWLTSHGIDAGRLTSAGFGTERPIATNDTDAGRQQNRRVEFHIDEEKK